MVKELFDLKGDSPVYSQTESLDYPMYSPLGSFDSPVYSSPESLDSPMYSSQRSQKFDSPVYLMQGRRESPVYSTEYCAGLVNQSCDVVLVRGAFSSGKPQGVRISEWGGNGEGWKWGDQFTNNLGPGWTDPVTTRSVPSK